MSSVHDSPAILEERLALVKYTNTMADLIQKPLNYWLIIYQDLALIPNKHFSSRTVILSCRKPDITPSFVVNDLTYETTFCHLLINLHCLPRLVLPRCTVSLQHNLPCSNLQFLKNIQANTYTCYVLLMFYKSSVVFDPE